MKPPANRRGIPWLRLDSRQPKAARKQNHRIPYSAHRLTTVPNSQSHAPVDPDIKLTTLASCAG